MLGILRETSDERHEDAVFDDFHLLLRRRDLLLVGLKFFGDIALGRHQRLFSYPLLRHLVAIGVAHFQIVAEHIVEAYLQALYARALYLALLHFQKVFLAVESYLATLVQLRIHTVADEAALGHLAGRIGHDVAANEARHLRELLKCKRTSFRKEAVAELTDDVHRLKRSGQSQEVAWRDTSCVYLANEALQIADALHLVVDFIAQIRIAEQLLYNILTGSDFLGSFQREENPTGQQTSAHGGHGAVDDLTQRDTVLAHRGEQFQTAHGELVQMHVLIRLNILQLSDVAQFRMLRHL